ncbi:WXG100 family type VII secretion target [Arthrobacter woluwensis]|jgi:WXG100 family type VII secretion target|uniref:WXG100 family type VII secretion target n=1 Tax=Arthrobacter woluwensis TaxID=156980 RepID=UPI001AAEE365|nr:WXG100 family type VII secretion target [Arthrobacter woluwensis]QTF70652.1 WXG100 family type VII secretion target [Arthrobacter woluwensis]
MSVISVDTELLHLQSGRVRGTMERISADIRAMNQGLTALQGSWRGNASASFQSLVAEWAATQNRVEASMAAINSALAQAAAQYRDVELTNAQRFVH